MAKDNICPRCGGGVPSDDNPGAYPGAVSRVDNETEICSACGTDEALTQFLNNGLLQPITMWPLTRERPFEVSEAILKETKDAD